MTHENNLLGKFTLCGIPPCAKGVPQIEVTFELNEDGILNASVVERSTNRSNQITITNDKGRLSKHQIDRMVKEAEMYRTQDEQIKISAQARISLEYYCDRLVTSLDIRLLGLRLHWLFLLLGILFILHTSF